MVAGAGAYVLATSTRDLLATSVNGIGDSRGARGQRGGGGSAENGSSQGKTSTRIIVQDSFDSPRSRVWWHFNGPWWQIAGGVLQSGPAAGWNELRASFVNSDFADGTVSLDATLLNGCGFGVVFHLNGDPADGRPFQGYCFQYDAEYGTGAFLLRKWINGVELNQPLAVDFPSASYQWDGVQRHIDVTTRGPLITARVDGQAVLSVSDSSFPSGGVGLRQWSSGDAIFDNLSISNT